MSPATKSKRRRSSRRYVMVHKPKGTLQPRVQRVSPEHFGIVSVDCGKDKSRWMFCDFYGRVLLEPADLIHGRGYFELAILQLRESLEQYQIKDLVVAIEQTGTYHRPVKRAFAQAGIETRIVHPFATKQLRLPDAPGNKTDDIDLIAIHRATVIGFGLLESPPDPLYTRLQVWIRHRRDLVEKRAALQCQIREHWEATLPGLGALFDLWNSPAVLAIARHYASPAAVEEAGREGLTRMLREAGQRYQDQTLDCVLAWARTAPSPDPQAEAHFHVAQSLDDDRIKKTQEIQDIERLIGATLVSTPYILLLGIPGINVVSAADLAAEMGPLSNYANAKAITGRAGLFPARYQSNEVDRADGQLIRCANRQLRGALMRIAENLRHHNHHFRGLAAFWDAQGKDPKRTNVKIVSRFSRIAYHILLGGLGKDHPCLAPREFVLDKLLAFFLRHDTPPATIVGYLQAAAKQLHPSQFTAEAQPLQDRLAKRRTTRRPGPQAIGEILVALLATLGVSDVQFSPQGA